MSKTYYPSVTKGCKSDGLEYYSMFSSMLKNHWPLSMHGRCCSHAAGLWPVVLDKLREVEISLFRHVKLLLSRSFRPYVLKRKSLPRDDLCPSSAHAAVDLDAFPSSDASAAKFLAAEYASTFNQPFMISAKRHCYCLGLNAEKLK